MSDAVSPVRLADARRAAARARFLATLEAAKHKLSPATLAQNTVSNVKDNVVRGTAETVRTRPGTVAAVAGAAVLFLARKPLARLIRPDAGTATWTEPANSDSSSTQRETKDPNHE